MHSIGTGMGPVMLANRRDVRVGKISECSESSSSLACITLDWLYQTSAGSRGRWGRADGLKIGGRQPEFAGRYPAGNPAVRCNPALARHIGQLANAPPPACLTTRPKQRHIFSENYRVQQPPTDVARSPGSLCSTSAQRRHLPIRLAGQHM